MANGVKLNGEVGLTELRQRRMYSFDVDGEFGPPIAMSGCSCPTPVPTWRATSWLFQRPAISYTILPSESWTYPEISNASLPRQPRGLKVRTHWSFVR